MNVKTFSRSMLNNTRKFMLMEQEVVGNKTWRHKCDVIKLVWQPVCGKTAMLWKKKD